MWTVIALLAVVALPSPTVDSGSVHAEVPDFVDTAPGDALGLEHRKVADAANSMAPKLPSGASLPASAFGATSVLVVGGMALGSLRRRRDDEPLVVVVHGNGGSTSDFDELLAAMDVPEDRVVVFDWRLAGEGQTSTEASRSAPTAVASRELEIMLRDLAETNSNIYTIHHSKGGAVGVDLIGRLDAGFRDPIDGYRGAALLDPAIASGPLGFVQRLGRISPWIPDNGDFNPIVCALGGCGDTRASLGKASGVEVIAIRNPDAELTNFADDPQGLRVYDLVDDGGSSAYEWLLVPPLAWARMSQAHNNVLTSPAVASCIKAEIDAVRSCVWTGSWTPRIGWRGGGAQRPVAM